MIKQSEICNFASLIKALKNQINSRSAGPSFEKKKSAMESRKNNLMRTYHYKKIYFNKIDFFQTMRKGDITEDSFSNLDIERKQDPYKKNILQAYCEEKRNRSFKLQNPSLHKLREVIHDRHGLIFPHKRSNTSQMKLNKQNSKIQIQMAQAAEPNKVKKEATKKRCGNFEKNERTKFSDPELVRRRKPNTSFQQYPRKNRLTVFKQPGIEKKDDERDWVIGGWQQPVDFGEECFE